MGQALFTGVTGLQAHQRKLDVVANNIANVNTTGYRGSRVLFQDLFSQTLQGATGPRDNYGGTNAMQVGLGVGVGTIDVRHEQGSLTTTGVASDMAIQGGGMFILNDGEHTYYTRDGSFQLNSVGTLIDPATGMPVQGYMADATGAINSDLSPTDLSIPIGGLTAVRASTQATLTGNLDSDAAVGTSVARTIRVYDSLGTPREVTLTFQKINQVSDSGTPYNAWTWQASYEGSNVTNVNPGETGVLLFDSNGSLYAEGSYNVGTSTFTPRSALAAQEVTIPLALFGGASVPTTPVNFDLGLSSMTQYAGETDVTMRSQDGYPTGALESYAIGRNGVITGVFTNGMTRVLGQMSLATFANVNGLDRVGNNMYRESSASGVAQVGLPNTSGRGEVTGGVLESSNVDLGTEFSNMIITQRGYQANARTITTADAMLQETVNLVR